MVVGAAAAGLIFGTVSVSNRLTQSPAPPGPFGSGGGPSVSAPASPQSPPLLSSPPGGPTGSPGAAPGPNRSTGTAPVTGPTVTETKPPAAGVGVPAGTTLTVHDGDMHVSTAGAMVSNVQVKGTLFIDAPNVTLVNVKVLPDGGFFGIKQYGANLTVRDSEISGDPATPIDYGISQEAAGLSVTRVLIRGVNAGIALGAGSVTVSGSRIDQLTGTSQTGIGGNGQTPNLMFSNNTILIDADAGAAIVLYGTSYDGVTIQGNTLAGGARTLIVPGGAGSQNVRVLDNRFSRMYYPDCGSIAPTTGYDPGQPGNQWSGNVWADTGLPIDP